MTNDPLDPPKPEFSDGAYALTKLGLSIVPGAGLAAELFGLIAPPLERRRDEWMKLVIEALRRLEEEQPERFRQLALSDLFASVCLQAAQAAMRAESEQKRVMLAAAVVNAARGTNFDADLQTTFVRYLDELTSSHIVLLSTLAENEVEVQRAGGYPQLLALFRQASASKCDEERFLLLCGDLNTRLLLRLSPYLETFKDLAETPVMAAEGPNEEPPLLARVTHIGHLFLAFVATDSEAPAT